MTKRIPSITRARSAAGNPRRYSSNSISSLSTRRQKRFLSHITIAICQCLIALCIVTFSASAQTNHISTNHVKRVGASPAVPAYIASLNALKSNRVVLESRKEQLEEQKRQLRNRMNLEQQAGQSWDATSGLIRSVESKISQVAKEIAGLKLQEFNIRERYGIPQEPPARMKKTR